MDHIETAILNCYGVREAEQNMVFAARLTQHGHTIQNMADLMDLYHQSLIRFLLADTQLFALCMFKPNITPGRLFIFQGSGGSIFNSLTYTKDERPFYRFQNELF